MLREVMFVLPNLQPDGALRMLGVADEVPGTPSLLPNSLSLGVWCRVPGAAFLVLGSQFRLVPESEINLRVPDRSVLAGLVSSR